NKQEPMLTILNMKDLDRCSASTVSLSVGEALSKNLLNLDTNTTNLPSGFRASEMPDKVEQWINELQIAAEHPDEVFVEEMLLAHEALSTD
ncbi:1872_t:CDS:2, partial [Racocetra fulgida]